MTITIKSTLADTPLVLGAVGTSETVKISLGRISPSGFSVFHRADFLAAVEAELGVRIVPADSIVIERSGLSPVALTGSGPWPTVSEGLPDGVYSVQAFRPNFTPDGAMQIARAWVAIAEYQTDHPPLPPVSDEDVETLAGLLLAEGLRSVGFATVARRLLATGKVEVRT